MLMCASPSLPPSSNEPVGIVWATVVTLIICLAVALCLAAIGFTP